MSPFTLNNVSVLCGNQDHSQEVLVRFDRDSLFCVYLLFLFQGKHLDKLALTIDDAISLPQNLKNISEVAVA